jgi:hypothetical protein
MTHPAKKFQMHHLYAGFNVTLFQWLEDRPFFAGSTSLNIAKCRFRQPKAELGERK